MAIENLDKKTINFYQELLKHLIGIAPRFLDGSLPARLHDDILNRLPSIPSYVYYDYHPDSSFKRACQYIDNLLFRLLFIREKMLYTNNRYRKEELDNFFEYFSCYREYIYEKAGGMPEAGKKDNALSCIYQGIERVVFMVTRRCQLRCRYCRGKKFNADMSKEVLYKGLALLKKSLRNRIKIHFFGGEPLLLYPLITEAARYAKDLFKDTSKGIDFSITTNALLLDEQKINFFKLNNFLVEASFEGDMQLQLVNRQNLNKTGFNAYNKVLNNIKSLIASGLDYRIITVIMPGDAHKMFDAFMELIGIGIKNIQINYALEVIWNRLQLEKLLEENKKILDYVKKHRDINFVNTSLYRQEPVILNRELAVDCDGMLFFETGFHLKNAKFNISPIDNVECIDVYSSTPFLNFYMLVKNYGDSRALRRIILNNLEVGLTIKKRFAYADTRPPF